MSKTKRLYAIAQSLAKEMPDFFDIKGAGAGDRATNAFMQELRKRAKEAFGRDFAEKENSGNNKLTVDYYFPDEETIVEVAMSLRNPASEFERDILKALMAQKAGYGVRRLLFLSKPGANKRCDQPGLAAIADWVRRIHHIQVEVREFLP